MNQQLFSSLSRKERFWLYITMVLAAAAIVVFAIFVAIIIQERIRTSDRVSRKTPNTAAAPFKGDNYGATHVVTPSTEPATSTPN